MTDVVWGLVALRSLKEYKKIVPLEIRKDIRLRLMHKACANITLHNILKLTPFQEPEFGRLMQEYELIEESEWRGR